MIKKMVFSLLLAHIQCIFAMEINYKEFFNACKNKKLSTMNSIIKMLSFNINHQNKHGETALLYSASWGRWDCVAVLLDHTPNKCIKDNYGQSVFSKSIRLGNNNTPFKKLLPHYSPEEINNECKSIPEYRNVEYKVISNLANYNHVYLAPTSTEKAFFNCNITEIVTLLRNDTKLSLENHFQNNYYKPLKSEPIIYFTIREAFNNGPCIPTISTSLLMQLFTTNLDESLLPEIKNIIKQYYIQLFFSDIDSMPEAHLWKPLCAEACKQSRTLSPSIAEFISVGINEKNENRCLIRVLMLPQQQKTKLNVKLALQDK